MSEIMTLETQIIQVIDKVMEYGTDIQMDQAWGNLERIHSITLKLWWRWRKYSTLR